MVVSDGRKVVNGRHMASIDLLQRRHDNDGLSVVVDRSVQQNYKHIYFEN